jgi:hypothetical protein
MLKHYIKIIACDDSHLPVVQARNLRIFVFSELRRVTARAAVRVVVARRGFVHLFATKTASHSRTEDYQQNRYKNHLTDALLVSRARPLKSYGLRLQNRGLGQSIGHLWGVLQSFHAKTFAKGCKMDPHFREAQAVRWILILERHSARTLVEAPPPVIR